MMHRERLRDARGQLERLALEERRYLDDHPYRLIHRYDPRAGTYSVRVEVERELPDELALLAAGVVRTLTATLDALAGALATPTGTSAATRFPIHDSLPQFAQRSRRALAGMPDEAQATIEELQPYHRLGGARNDPLWLLRELGGVDSIPLAAGALRDETTLGVNTSRHVDVTGELRATPGAFLPGAVVVTVAAKVAGPDPKLDLYVKPAYELALTRDGPARGAPLVATLGVLCDYVEHEVLPRLEAGVARG